MPSSRAAATPDVAARPGQGADAQVRPPPRQHPAAHLLNRDLLARLPGPCHLLLPRAEVPRTGDPSSNPGDPVHYEFNLVTGAEGPGSTAAGGPARTSAPALSMITKKNRPMRAIFFRDHEISGLRPTAAPSPVSRPGGSGQRIEPVESPWS